MTNTQDGLPPHEILANVDGWDDAKDCALIMGFDTRYIRADLAKTRARPEKIDPTVIRALKQYRDEYCMADSEYGIAIDKFLKDHELTEGDDEH